MDKRKIEVPDQLKARPVYGGYITPYFVAWYLDGKQVHEKTAGAVPSFVTIDVTRATHCRTQGLCWCCGKMMGAHKWFVFGPGSAVAQQSVEPPSHRDCAQYAVQVCPFMLDPDRAMRAPKAPLKEGQVIDLEMSTHNPGVSVLWATKRYEVVAVNKSHGTYVFEPGEPELIEFWREGRKATRAEIKAAIDHSLKLNGYKATDREVAWRVDKVMRFAPED